ncbi:oligosaccharide repeat unit polymerase Wzy [Streptococcus pneumoniae]|nr:oligosaccharide repeat unit polymerase Wzy [Streptococcus pneumoniae]VIV56366.1 oligosaccharide repeat unit polymerase Wzy [Streptococcus pneumoniae]VIV72301.1 oligosaccharide repeat unit polymerase Wzy [Streptococcus pneumoniae]VIX45751.1 oligosaccharide repeat unit polymerase Wzy [Streptococcus pneumoniae]VJB09079.1 oligosaccharide repeat unit polymerase Wzy [Streptococcus pneumoniae]
MLLNFLFIFIFLLIIITFILFEGDLFQPAVILTLAYFISIASALVNRNVWGTELHFKTFGLILLGVATFIIVSLLTKLSYKPKVEGISYKELKEINPSKIIYGILLILNLVMLFLYIHEIQKVVLFSGRGFSNITDLISNYRYLSYYSNEVEDRVSGMINQLAKIIPATTFVSLYIFINNYFITKQIKKNFIYLIPIAIFFVYAIISGGRLPLIRLVIGTLLILYIYSVYGSHKSQLTRSFKMITRSLFAFLMLIVLFFLLKFVLGRSSQEDFITYITRYMGGSIQLFDLFVIDPIRRNKELGAETFSGIYEMLAKLGFDNNIIKGLEWRISPNYYSLGNVYTAIRRYYSDFGVIGIVICQSFTAWLYTLGYEKIRHHSLVTNGQRFRLILLAASFYPLFLNSIEDVFYISMVTIGYGIQIVIFYLVFWVLLKVQVDFNKGKLRINR